MSHQQNLHQPVTLTLQLGLWWQKFCSKNSFSLEQLLYFYFLLNLKTYISWKVIFIIKLVLLIYYRSISYGITVGRTKDRHFFFSYVPGIKRCEPAIEIRIRVLPYYPHEHVTKLMQILSFSTYLGGKISQRMWVICTVKGNSNYSLRIMFGSGGSVSGNNYNCSILMKASISLPVEYRVAGLRAGQMMAERKGKWEVDESCRGSGTFCKSMVSAPFCFPSPCEKVSAVEMWCRVVCSIHAWFTCIFRLL